MLVVVRLRGHYNIRGELEDTLKMLNLTRVNACAVFPDEPSYKGMIKKVKDQVAYGIIDAKVLALMLKKRGRVGSRKLNESWLKENGYDSCDALAKALAEGKTTIKSLGIKPLFRLTPARKGLKSSKIHYPRGDLGDQKEKINELLLRMI